MRPTATVTTGYPRDTQGLAAAILLPIGLALLSMMTPFILVSSQCASRPQKGQTTAEECLAYAQGYAKGVEDTASYRRRDEEAEAKLAKMSRVRHDQIVDFEPYDDGWFTFNLATNQAQM